MAWHIGECSGDPELALELHKLKIETEALRKDLDHLERVKLELLQRHQTDIEATLQSMEK